MLPAASRLRRSGDFSAVLRSGQRAGGGGLLVVHMLRITETRADRTRFGLVVSKAVGNSVVRHRVSRRLRALLADRNALFAPGMDVVVRALAPAGNASSAQLGAALDKAVRKLATPRQRSHARQAELSEAR